MRILYNPETGRDITTTEEEAISQVEDIINNSVNRMINSGMSLFPSDFRKSSVLQKFSLNDQLRVSKGKIKIPRTKHNKQKAYELLTTWTPKGNIYSNELFNSLLDTQVDKNKYSSKVMDRVLRTKDKATEIRERVIELDRRGKHQEAWALQRRLSAVINMVSIDEFDSDKGNKMKREIRDIETLLDEYERWGYFDV